MNACGTSAVSDPEQRSQNVVLLLGDNIYSAHYSKYMLPKPSVFIFAILILSHCMQLPSCFLLSVLRLFYVRRKWTCVHRWTGTHRNLPAETSLGVDPSDIKNLVRYRLYYVRKMTQCYGHKVHVGMDIKHDKLFNEMITIKASAYTASGMTYSLLFNIPLYNICS